MDTIRIDLEGDRIVLSFRREVGNIRKVRYLTAEEAVGVGLLITADAPEQAITNIDVTAELSLQIINAPYENIYFSVRDRRGERTLVVSIEGKAIKDIGRHLLRLAKIVSGSKAEKVGTFVSHVSHCYLDEAETE